jgi:hypothetical protein
VVYIAGNPKRTKEPKPKSKPVWVLDLKGDCGALD